MLAQSGTSANTVDKVPRRATKNIDEEETNGDEEEQKDDDLPREFRFLLNGQEDLEAKLLEFKEQCDAHDKHVKHRRKRRYYQLGMVATLVPETTHDEMRRMLENGVYTFHVDSVAYKAECLNKILDIMNVAIIEYGQEQTLQTVTSLALEINGECCRVGRLRNNCTVLLPRGAVITLTTDSAYRYCGFKEIVYIINLRTYIGSIKLGDIIYIGREVRCRVVKTLSDNIAVLIIDAGLLTSYDYLELPHQCHILSEAALPEEFMDDLELLARLQANYVVLPKIRCKGFLRAARRNLKERSNMKIIGVIDFEFIRQNMLDLLGIIKLLDYIWIPDMFSVNCCIYNYIMEDVLPIAFCQKKPIIGTVPLERCNDFKRFENHEFLYRIDSMLIQKSPWCNKYPLIAKKLTPINDFRIGVVQNEMTVKSVLSSYQTIVNFIIRTISSIECMAIFLYTKCEAASVALARTEIYCPVYMVLPIDETDDEAAVECKHNLARMLYLRRNMIPLVYTKYANICNYDPIEFGVDLMRRLGCIKVGDFILTIEVGKEDDENVSIGIGDDVVILRAYYVPPLKNCERFKYGTTKI